MEPLPIASNAWPAFQTLLLVSQTIILLTFLASHKSQRQDQTPQPLLQAIQDAVAPRTSSTQALVEKAQVSYLTSHLSYTTSLAWSRSLDADGSQQLVAELNSLLVSIDGHHEEILQLRRQIQLVNHRIRGHPSQNNSTLGSVDQRLRDPSASVPSDDRSGDASRSSRRGSGKRSHGERSLETEDPGDDGGSQDSEATSPGLERRKRGGRVQDRRKHKKQDQDLDIQ